MKEEERLKAAHKSAYTGVLRRALRDCDYKWPEQLSSGVMFYEGQRITIEDFKKQANLFK